MALSQCCVINRLVFERDDNNGRARIPDLSRGSYCHHVARLFDISVFSWRRSENSPSAACAAPRSKRIQPGQACVDSLIKVMESFVITVMEDVLLEELPEPFDQVETQSCRVVAAPAELEEHWRTDN